MPAVGAAVKFTAALGVTTFSESGNDEVVFGAIFDTIKFNLQLKRMQQLDTMVKKNATVGHHDLHPSARHSIED